MASSGEGGTSLPSPRRRGMVAPPAPVATTPWMENALATQAMTTVPLRMVVPRPAKRGEVAYQFELPP
jgi:hypothetical protein